MKFEEPTMEIIEVDVKDITTALSNAGTASDDPIQITP